jgi:hypothetical protein
MSAQRLVERYRLFLLGLAAFLCLGTVTELILTEHTQEPLQFVPFVLCGLALVVIVAALFRPTRAALLSVRIMMGALVLGSLVGVYEHLESNKEILLETKPGLAPLDMLWRAVTGAAPLLAPGILVLVAVLALAATYAHPALEQGRR